MSDTAQQHIEGDTESGLPEGWTIAKLGDLCTHPQYGWTTSANKNGIGLKLLRTTDISSGAVNWSTVPACAQEPDDPQKYLLAPGDILVSRAGSVGLSYLVKKCPETVFASYLIRFRPKPPLESEFIALLFKSPQYWAAIAGETAGIAIPNVNASKLKELEVPFPPLAEQKRIVAKVEQLLTRVNTPKERLAKVSMVLKRFRQAVLAAACSGHLTADWREQQTNIESASVLHERLLHQYPRMNNGAFFEDGLPEIPENWVWAKVGQLGDVITGSTPSKKEVSYFGGSIPFFKPTDLDAGYNVENSIDSLTEEGAEIARTLPPLAVMVTCIGATIGKTGLARVAGATNQQINSVVTNHELVSPYWLFWTFTSPWVHDQIKLHASETTLPILNKGRFEKLFLPLPPLTEQQEIVRRVESIFKLADAIEKRLAAATVWAQKLTQAILAKAFRGELVPTEAGLARREGHSYEPASVLLARIKSARDSKRSPESVNRIRGPRKRMK